MANKFVKQGQLPYTNKDVQDAVKERLGDLGKFRQEFHQVKTDAKSIRQILTLQCTGSAPDSDDDDPTVDAAHKQSVDLVTKHERLLREVPANAKELEAMRAEANKKKAAMDNSLSGGSLKAISSAEIMKMAISKDVMRTLVEAVTTRHGSLDFLRDLGSEHRQLLFSKEEEIAQYKRAQQASSDAEFGDVGEDEIIPATYPELAVVSTQDRQAQQFADLQSAHSKAERKAKELERQVADLEAKLAAEKEASTRAQDSLHQQLVENEEVLKGRDSIVEQQKELLATSEQTVVRLEGEAEELNDKIAELELGVIAKDDLMANLQDARSEVKTLKGRVEKMELDVQDKQRLEREIAEQQEKLDTVEKENEGLHQELQGKRKMLDACNAAKDSAQRLADECQADLRQKKVELEKAVSLQKETEKSYHETRRREKRYHVDYQHELATCQATIHELLEEQGRVKARDGEIRTLQDMVKSKEKSLQDAEGELEQLTYQIRDKEEQLEAQDRSAEEVQANLANVSKERADAELDTEFLLRVWNLSMHISDVGLPGWIPLLRSLRASGPVEVTPEEGRSRQTWLVLPSWPGSETGDGTGSDHSGLPCAHASFDSLLLELYGHGMAEGEFSCNPCLQAICNLCPLVESQGVAKADSLVLVLQKLEARLRGLEVTSGYEGMVMLGLRYLAALVRTRMSGDDIPGLSAVEDSLDGMMKHGDKCLGVIRHVSDGLCSSGGIETVEASQGLRLTSQAGRTLVLLADGTADLFLLADPEERTVRAVSCHRLDRNVSLSETGGLVSRAIIEAPAGQSHIDLDLTAEEADWIQENL